MADKTFAGGAKALALSAGITAGDASFSVSGDTTGWPSGVGQQHGIIVGRGLANEEKMLVTRSGTAFTVITRGADGTTAASHVSGEAVEHVYFASDAQDANTHMGSTAAHGATGAVVGTTNVQTLSGKTLTQPTIGDFTNAGHTHAAAASGGAIPTASPTASAVGDVSVTGTAVTVSRTDHKHAREGFGNPVASTVGDTTAAGAAATVARSDHRHAREAFHGAPEDVHQTTASAGAATTPSRGDHVHKLPSDSPRGVLAYVSGTSVESFSAAASMADLVATVASNSASSRIWKFTVRAEVIQTNVLGTVIINVLRDGVVIGRAVRDTIPVGSRRVLLGSVIVEGVPVGGQFSVQMSTTTGVVETSADAASPSWLLIEDIGA